MKNKLYLILLIGLVKIVAQGPYVIYYAVDELSLSGTNCSSSVELSYYHGENILQSNFYPDNLKASITETNAIDGRIKAGYFYSNYGKNPTGLQASYRNNEMASQRILMANIKAKNLETQANSLDAVMSFRDDIPKTVDYAKSISLSGGGVFDYKIKGTFAMVEESKIYPILIAPIGGDPLHVHTEFATIQVPDFLRYFPASEIGWIRDGQEIKDSTGYTFRFSKDIPIKENCGLHNYRPFLKNPKFKNWTIGSIQINFDPNLEIGRDIIIEQPLCRQLQSLGDFNKYKGFVVSGNSINKRGFKLKIANSINTDTAEVTFNRDSGIELLSVQESPFSLIFEEFFRVDLNGGDIYSCRQTIKNIIITPPKPISIVKKNFKEILCFGEKPSLELQVEGNAERYTLAYGDSVKNLQRGQLEQILLEHGSRNYEFTLSDENGCVYEDSIKFKAVEPPKLEAKINIAEALCHDGNATIKIDATGGIPYLKGGGYRYAVASDSLPQVSGTFTRKAGSTLWPKVYDSHNCVVQLKDTLLRNPADFKIGVLEKTHNNCAGGNNGSVRFAGQSIDSSYSYRYALEGKYYTSNPNKEDLPAGTYKLLVRNQNACTKDTTITITAPPAIAITKIAQTDVRCFGESNGAISLQITGGTGAKKLWKAEEQVFAPKIYSFEKSYKQLAATNHTFYVRDSLGCLDSASFTINTRSQIKYIASQSNPVCNKSHNGMLHIGVSGGVEPYTHSWQGPASLDNNLKQLGLAEGTYILSSTDALNCSLSDTFTLIAPPELPIHLEGYPLICKGQSLELDAGPLGTQYEWTSNNGFKAHTRKVNLTSAGTYAVKVINQQGCEGSDSFVLQQSDTDFKADFLVASHVTVGDTLLLLNDNFLIDSLQWGLLSATAQQLNPLPDFRAQQVIFTESGSQEVELTGYYKGCKATKKRSIQVITPEERYQFETAIGIKTSIVRNCGLFPNPNDGSFEVQVETSQPNVDLELTLSSLGSGSILQKRNSQAYNEHKIVFEEELPEGPYVIHVKAGAEVVALRFLVTRD